MSLDIYEVRSGRLCDIVCLLTDSNNFEAAVRNRLNLNADDALIDEPEADYVDVMEPTKKIRLIEAELIDSMRAGSGTKLNTLPSRKKTEPAAKTIPIHQFISCGIQKQRRNSPPMDSSLPASPKGKPFR